MQRPGLNATFTYDHAGIRTGKRVSRGGAQTHHEFYTQGGRIVAETRRHPNGSVETLEFIYDESGRPLQLMHTINAHTNNPSTTVYNYVLNLQGDVQQIRHAGNGAVVATYLYNAWGQLLSVGRPAAGNLPGGGHIADVNPIRYRGYYQCLSSGFYYLQSRYYCPVIGRFINADGFISTGQGMLGFNMFAYCLNDPVNRIDPTGYVSMAGWCWNQYQQQRNQPQSSVPWSRQEAEANTAALNQLRHMYQHGTDPTRGTPLNQTPTQIITLQIQIAAIARIAPPHWCQFQHRADLGMMGVTDGVWTWQSSLDTFFAASEGFAAVAPFISSVPIVGKFVSIYGIIGVVWNTNRRAGNW